MCVYIYADQCPVQWVRIDPSWEWLCTTKMYQQERMWLNQLKHSKDVIAQTEAVEVGLACFVCCFGC